MSVEIQTTDPPKQGWINIKLELYDYKGIRINVECISLFTSTFLDESQASIYSKVQQMIADTRKEILTPSEKTVMQ